MKILLCTNVFEVVENGPVKFAHLLLQINDLYPQHEVRILTEDISVPGPYIHKVNMAKYWQKSLLSQFVRMWTYHRAAMRLRRTYAFDVLVYNNALVGLWSAYRFSHTIGMINDDNNLPAGPKQVKLSLAGIKRFVFRLAEKRMALRARSIIVNSDYLKEAVQNAYGIPAQKVYRLYKAVALPTDAPQTCLFPSPTEPIRILFVKNDFRRGGLFTLLNALGKLPYRFVLSIIGPAESDRNYILSKFFNLLNVKAVFIGKVPPSVVSKEMTLTHIFCVPSYQEALGVANLEAMALGIPVVSTHAGGIPEVLDQGRCGWLVPPHDTEALARALEDCISRPDIRTLKIAQAHQQVKRFDTMTMFENFLKIIGQ